MSVTHDQYRRARYIVEPASTLVLKAIRPNNRGRKTLNPLILLVGMQLSIDCHNLATISQIYHVLIKELTLRDQLDLGVKYVKRDGTEHELTIHELYSLTKRITHMLDYSVARAPHLTHNERMVRRAQVDAIVAALLSRTLPPRPKDSADYALDGTGIWASEKADFPLSENEAPEPVHEEDLRADSANLTSILFANQKAEIQALTCTRRRGPSDGGLGVKTSKNGKRKEFYGYDVEALVRVPSLKSDKGSARLEPNLVESLVVITASKDIVNPCLNMFDRLIADGKPIKTLLVDRHYSYKRYDRWMKELLHRGIDQVADMHAKDQGFKNWDGLQMASGWAHCPQTPARLAVIPTLGPTASNEDKEKFNALVDERRAYAAKRINPLDAEGRIRFGCPALDGSVGCALRAGTEATAIRLNLPIIENPPALEGRPSICTQKSVLLQVRTKNEMMALKMAQRHYWGSPEWRTSYSRRTYVEGWFGVLKNESATGFNRGTHQFVGLPLVSIVFGMAAATTNLRLLRSWHEKTGLGNPDHELLKPDRIHHGYAELTEEQARNIIELAARPRETSNKS